MTVIQVHAHVQAADRTMRKVVALAAIQQDLAGRHSRRCATPTSAWDIDRERDAVGQVWGPSCAGRSPQTRRRPAFSRRYGSRIRSRSPPRWPSSQPCCTTRGPARGAVSALAHRLQMRQAAAGGPSPGRDLTREEQARRRTTPCARRRALIRPAAFRGLVGGSCPSGRAGPTLSLGRPASAVAGQGRAHARKCSRREGVRRTRLATGAASSCSAKPTTRRHPTRRSSGMARPSTRHRPLS